MIRWLAERLGCQLASLIIGIGIGQGAFGDPHNLSVGPLNLHMVQRHISTFTYQVKAIGRGDYRGAGFRY